MRPSRLSFVLVGAMASAPFGLFAAEAHAESSLSRHSKYESPQRFAAEVRFSPYVPQIDSEPGLTGKPYESTFGTMPRLMFAGELDWQAFRIPHLGSIGPGLGFGYTNMSDTARLLRDNTPSGDETSLDIWQSYAVAVLRADVLWRDFGVPIVPYGKAGLGLGLWRAANTGGTAEYQTGAGPVSGKGYSFGTHFALGAALALNFVDRGAAVNLDQSVGINNTYFYAEYYFSTLNGIAQSNALRVGANTWAMGLAFEF